MGEKMKKFILLLLIATPLFAQKIELPVSGAKNPYTIENSTYSVGFAENYGIPVWEMHVLQPQMLAGGATAKPEWKQDNRVKGNRISPKDIESIKLEPVQLYPKDHAMNNTTAQESSYLTSNIVFMNKQLKDSIWENITSSFESLAQKYGTVYTYSGPIFEKESLKIKYLLGNRIASPSYFYRVVLYFEDGKPVQKCYRIANRIPPDYERNCDISEFAYNIYQLEADTNIDFFDRDIDANFRQEKMKYLEKRVK